jgi:hypothetical protein
MEIGSIKSLSYKFALTLNFTQFPPSNYQLTWRSALHHSRPCHDKNFFSISFANILQPSLTKTLKQKVKTIQINFFFVVPKMLSEKISSEELIEQARCCHGDETRTEAGIACENFFFLLCQNFHISFSP